MFLIIIFISELFKMDLLTGKGINKEIEALIKSKI